MSAWRAFEGGDKLLMVRASVGHRRRRRGTFGGTNMSKMANDSDIAVIGMAACLPGAKDVDEFWDLLRRGKEGLTRFERVELLAAGERPELLEHPDYVKVRGVQRRGESLFGRSRNSLQTKAGPPRGRRARPLRA